MISNLEVSLEHLQSAKDLVQKTIDDLTPSSWPRKGGCSGFPILVNSSSEQDREISLWKEVGAEYLRLDCTTLHQAQLDVVVRKILALGIEPYLCLHGSTGVRTPSNIYDFAKLMSKKFAGMCRFYSNCNEPDLKGWTPQQYGETCPAFYDGIKENDPNAIVIIGELFKWKTTFNPNDPNNTAAFVRGMYPYCKGKFEALSIHGYDPLWWNDPRSIWHQTYRVPGNVLTTMTANGDGNKKILCGEMGHQLQPEENSQVQANNLAGQLVETDARGQVMNTLYKMIGSTHTGYNVFGRPAFQIFKNY